MAYMRSVARGEKRCGIKEQNKMGEGLKFKGGRLGRAKCA